MMVDSLSDLNDDDLIGSDLMMGGARGRRRRGG